MNFSVHFDDATLERLNKAVERSKMTRNRIIVTAVQAWLDANEERDWPEVLKAHFRNPAPELAEEALDFQAWRSALGAETGVQW
ncbi:CopG family transcriptional regulator [Sinimarinibacterium sp. NLF-5-8]|uniref:CopG family transcriptional regulator n=1 Tax=Sinimarinibacterium sp. NLF-5-8 TaxID=2698684 RepID=UPI00137BA585|nr:CopG family transcriptional regulator [Sinimarinibacterium sp. NLF-5-8]QHS09633.1 CopG family transcriptional regulator [Sinimarinibacterium sp. NLF-5-8]